MATTTREQKLEDAILEAIINMDRLPALSGYSDAVIYAADEIIARLKAVLKSQPGERGIGADAMGERLDVATVALAEKGIFPKGGAS